MPCAPMQQESCGLRVRIIRSRVEYFRLNLSVQVRAAAKKENKILPKAELPDLAVVRAALQTTVISSSIEGASLARS
jgi:hypothetical protein